MRTSAIDLWPTTHEGYSCYRLLRRLGNGIDQQSDNNTSASKKENTMAGNNLTRRDFVAAVAASALMPSVLPVGLPSEPAITPFHYRALDAALDDLKRRLAQTRWPDQETVPG